MLKVSSAKEAWELADKLFPSDYMEDEQASECAGYSIYRSTVKNSTDHISDLGCRLELNIGNTSKNIWIEESEQATAMRKYMVYVDDGGEHCMKIAVPARNKKEAEAYVNGNGEVIAVKDVMKDFPIDLNKVDAALHAAGFGKPELDFIARALEAVGIAEYR